MYRTLALVLFTYACTSKVSAQSPALNGTNSSFPIQNAHLVSAAYGWVLAGGNLFWTTNNGESWSNITPPLGETREIDSIYFLDQTNAWAVLHDTSAAGIYMARTSTAGSTWTVKQLAADDAEMNQMYGNHASLAFSDLAHGWVLLTKTSSTAASIAGLFATQDGGASWSLLPDPPGAGEIRFFGQIGWLVGGVNGRYGNHLWVTRDGGQNWQSQTVQPPSAVALASEVVWDYHLPVFNDANHGTFSVNYSMPNPAGSGSMGNNYAGIYNTADGGNTWQLASSYKRSSMGHSTTVNSTAIESIAAGGNTVVTGTHTSMHVAPLPSQLPPGHFDTNMLTFSDPNNGWILISRNRGCVVPGCQIIDALLSTQDGGVTVRLLLEHTNTVPKSSESSKHETPEVYPGPGAAVVVNGPTYGLDSCSNMDSIAGQLITAHDYDGWTSMGIYIGGATANAPKVKCWIPNSPYGDPWLATMSCGGYTFVPIYDDLQAPCNTSMSQLINPATVRGRPHRARTEPAFSRMRLRAVQYLHRRIVGAHYFRGQHKLLQPLIQQFE